MWSLDCPTASTPRSGPHRHEGRGPASRSGRALRRGWCWAQQRQHLCAWPWLSRQVKAGGISGPRAVPFRKNATRPYSSLPGEAVFANGTGMLVVAFGLLVLYLLQASSWKRPEVGVTTEGQVRLGEGWSREGLPGEVWALPGRLTQEHVGYQQLEVGALLSAAPSPAIGADAGSGAPGGRSTGSGWGFLSPQVLVASGGQVWPSPPQGSLGHEGGVVTCALPARGWSGRRLVTSRVLGAGSACWPLCIWARRGEGLWASLKDVVSWGLKVGVYVNSSELVAPAGPGPLSYAINLCACSSSPCCVKGSEARRDAGAASGRVRLDSLRTSAPPGAPTSPPRWLLYAVCCLVCWCFGLCTPSWRRLLRPSLCTGPLPGRSHACSPAEPTP